MTTRPLPLVEACVEGIDGVAAAVEAGADRIELCAGLELGGLTPSLGTIRRAVAAPIPVHVIIRPRGGDFLYSDAEFATMLEDVALTRQAGAAGVVVGCLREDGTVDEARMTALAAAARPLSVTCHRAFDMTCDPFEALEALIRCSIDRVLTSGQRDRAIDAVATLRRLNEQARGRIIVMGCGRLDVSTIAGVARMSGLRELHFAALRTEPSAMAHRNVAVGMAGEETIDREYWRTVTDIDAMRAMIAQLRSNAGC
jgi:copper homeostasis protein